MSLLCTYWIELIFYLTVFALVSDKNKAPPIFTSIAVHPSASSGRDNVGNNGGGGGRKRVLDIVDLLVLSCTDGTVSSTTYIGLIGFPIITLENSGSTGNC